MGLHEAGSHKTKKTIQKNLSQLSNGNLTKKTVSRRIFSVFPKIVEVLYLEDCFLAVIFETGFVIQARLASNSQSSCLSLPYTRHQAWLELCFL